LIVVPVSSGGWSLGPSLLYLFGMIAVLGWIDWKCRAEREKTPEELMEECKREAFTKLMQEAAERRK
jgi:hypothetical protein